MSRELTEAERSESKALLEELRNEELRWSRNQMHPSMLEVDTFDLNGRLGTLMSILMEEFGVTQEMMDLHYRRFMFKVLSEARERIMAERRQAGIAAPNGKIIIGPDGNPLSM